MLPEVNSGAMFSKSEVQETDEMKKMKMELKCKDNSYGCKLVSGSRGKG